MNTGLKQLDDVFFSNTYKQKTIFYQKLIKLLNNSKIQNIEYFEQDQDNLSNSIEEILSVGISYNVNQTQYTETTIYQQKNLNKYEQFQSSIVERANNEQDQILQTLIENQKIEKLIDEEINDENLEKSLMTSYLLLRGKSRQLLFDNQNELLIELDKNNIQKQPKSSQNINQLKMNMCKSGNIKLCKRRNALATESQLIQDTSKLRIIPSCNTNWSNFKIENLVQIQKSNFKNNDNPEDYIRRQQTHANFQQQFSKEMSNYVTDVESEESSYVENKSELISLNSNSTKVLNNMEPIIPHNSTQTNFNQIYDTTSYKEDEAVRELEYINYVVQRNINLQIKKAYQQILDYAQHQRYTQRSKIDDLLNVMGQYQNKLKRIQKKIKLEKMKKLTQSKIKQQADYEKLALCYSLQKIFKKKTLQNFRLIFSNQIQQQNYFNELRRQNSSQRLFC